MSANVEVTVHANTDQAASEIKKFFGELQHGIGELSGFKEMLGEVSAALAAVVTIGAMVEFTKQAIEGEAALARLSNITGIAVETLSALQDQARKNGVAQEEFNTSIGMFADKIYLAARNGGQMAQNFRDLNISLTNSRGELLPTAEILNEVMDKFKSMPDGPQKVAAAMEFFGRAGRQMIPLLNEGSEALKELAKSATVTGEQAERAHELEKAVVDLKTDFQALWRHVANELVPILQDLMKWIKEVEKSSHALSIIATLLVEVFKVLATEASVVLLQFRMLWDIIANGLSLQLKTMIEGWKLVQQVFVNVVEVVKVLLSELGELIVVMGNMGQIEADVLSGHFIYAFNDAVEATKQFVNFQQQAATNISGSFHDAFSSVKDFTVHTWENAQTTGKKMMSELLRDNEFFREEMKKLWGKGESHGADNKENGNGNTPVATSQAGLQLIDQLQKAYSQATQGRIALINEEEKELTKKINLELKGDQQIEALRQLEVIQEKKRLAVVEEGYQKQLDLQQAKLQFIELDDLAGVNTDKYRQELDKLNRSLWENIQYLLAKKEIEANPDEVDAIETKLAALRVEKLKTEKELFNLTPTGQMLKPLTDWATQIGTIFQQIGHTITNVIGTAVNSISSSLTKVIMGTMTWKAALAQIGTSILEAIIQGIIQMGVQWVIQEGIKRVAMLATALVSKTIHAEENAESAKTLAVSGAAGAAKSGEQGGWVGVLIYLAVFAAALGAIAGMAGGFAEGGHITGPGGPSDDSIPIRASNGEYMIKAATVDKYGVPFMDALNSGQPMSIGSVDAGGMSGAPAVHVNSAPAQVVVLDNQDKYRQWLESNPGKHQVVQIVAGNKRGLGMKT